MGESQPPQVVIPLIDGRFLAIGPDGIRDGQRFFALTTLLRAERLATVPETLAFEAQTLGQIVFQPARPGDAAVALDALYRLRPELRPAATTATGVVMSPDVNSGAQSETGAPAAAPSSTPTTPTWESIQGTAADTAPGEAAGADTAPVDGAPPTPASPTQPTTLPPPTPPPAAPAWDATPAAPPAFAYPPYPGSAPYPGAPLPPGAPGYQPNPAYPPTPPYPPYAPGALPPGAQYPPYGAYPYAPPLAAPGAPASGLPPYPRGFGDLLGAIFTRYGKYFWPLVRLALVAVLLPEVIVGLAQVAIYVIVGANPLAPALDTTTPLLKQLGASVPATGLTGPTLSISQFQVYSQLNLLVVLVALLAGAWEVALMAQGAREAALGRPVRVGAAVRAGLRRVLPTLGITLLVALIAFAALLPGLIALTLAAATGSAGAAFLGFVLISAGVVFAIFLSVRLTLAPYIAALGLGRSISRSWQLTQGHWWRTFGAIFLIGLIVSLVEGVFGNVQAASYLVGVAIVTPLVVMVATPLLTLTYTTLLYDLRLRHDGYPTVMREG